MTGGTVVVPDNIIRLLMLTGCRLGEILTLKWDYVDLAKCEFRLPVSKTGAKIVHFGKTAAKVLKAIAKVPDNPYVITGRKPGGRLVELQHAWGPIRGKAGLDDVRIHDLRHSYASNALALGEGLPMIGKLLGHKVMIERAITWHQVNDDGLPDPSRLDVMYVATASALRFDLRVFFSTHTARPMK